MSWSILHGGPGLKHLSHAAYCIVNDLPYETKDAVATVFDNKLKKIPSAMEICTCDEQCNAAKES